MVKDLRVALIFLNTNETHQNSMGILVANVDLENLYYEIRSNPRTSHIKKQALVSVSQLHLEEFKKSEATKTSFIKTKQKNEPTKTDFKLKERDPDDVDYYDIYTHGINAALLSEEKVKEDELKR